jgi:AraC-like DNA-binding protein
MDGKGALDLAVGDDFETSLSLEPWDFRTTMTGLDQVRAFARSGRFHLIVWPTLFGVATTLNALNAWQEVRRNGLPFHAWEPFAWEYTSLVGDLVGVALALLLLNGSRGRTAGARILLGFAALAAFFVSHVGLMVALRHALYAMIGDAYDFGDLASELFYEFRKDVLAFGVVLLGWWLAELARRPGRSEPKYARSALTDADYDRIMVKVLAAAAERRLHRDPNLGLPGLAAMTGVSPNDLSQTLNVRAGGFHHWLAETRIADAQAMLRSGEASSLIDAAYAVGFNSKSTFYSAFRRATGQTPGAWWAETRAGGPAASA